MLRRAAFGHSTRKVLTADQVDPNKHTDDNSNQALPGSVQLPPVSEDIMAMLVSNTITPRFLSRKCLSTAQLAPQNAAPTINLNAELPSPVSSGTLASVWNNWVASNSTAASESIPESRDSAPSIYDHKSVDVAAIECEWETSRSSFINEQYSIMDAFSPPPSLSFSQLIMPSSCSSYKPSISSIDADELVPYHRIVRSKRQLRQRNRAVRIFFSSTFRDMNDERELIIKKVMPELRSIYLKRGVFISEIDLRWGITSEQSSEGNTLCLCLQEVDKCRPWFVCLLGERYDILLKKTFDRASVDFPWVSSYPLSSVTELEIRHSFLNAPSESNHAVFLFRDESYSKKRGSVFESESDHSRIHEYRTPEEAAMTIKSALQQLLDKDFPEETIPTPQEIEKEAHDAFQVSRTRIYVGRESTIQSLILQTSSSISSGTGHPCPIVVAGESGTGKSALLANFAAQYEQSHPDQVVITHYVGCTSSSTSLNSMLHRLMCEISLLYKFSRDIPTDKHKLIEEFPNWLAEAGSKTGLVLIIDAIDQLKDESTQELNWLPPQFPPRVQVILSSRPSHSVEVARSRLWSVMQVEPLSRLDIACMAQSILNQYGKSLASSQLQMIQDTKQCQMPLFLKTLLDELHSFGVYEELSNRIATCLSSTSLSSLFGHVFTRVESDLGPQSGTLGNVLSSIYVSRRGLYDQEILEICAISQALWSTVLLSLKELFFVHAGLVSFSHEYVRDAVRERYLHSSNQERQAHHILIEYFSSCTTSPRQTQELSYQYYVEGESAHLASFVTSPKTFLELASPETKFDLFLYWREIVAKSPTDNNLVSDLSRYIAENPNSVSQVDLYIKSGKVLQELGKYNWAITCYSNAYDIAQHSSTLAVQLGEICGNLGYVHRLAGNFKAAIPYYHKAIEIQEKNLGLESSELALSLNNLAIVYRKLGRYTEAEPLYLRALKIREKKFGYNHPEVGHSYNSLGCLYQDLNNDLLAESNFRKALQIREASHGPKHPDVAMTLSNLASLLIDMSRYDDAEILLTRALDIYEYLFGTLHPDVARVLNEMAGNCMEKGQYDQAEEFFKKSLQIKEQLLGSDHPDIALTLNDYAVLFSRQDRRSEAQPLYERALAIRTKAFGVKHPDTAQSMNNLAELKAELGDFKAAELMYRESLDTLLSLFGENHCNVASTLNLMANVAQRQHKPFEEIMPIYQRALKILHATLGKTHPDVALTLNDMAVLCQLSSRFSEAEGLFSEALAVNRAVFKDEAHRDVHKQRRALESFYSAWAATLPTGSPESAQVEAKRRMLQATSLF
ncbi:tetratricopeptide repeat protein [Pelomyxa schiedti]|nr:tetratricopeptide repeat protein [Pelomyxa schiedti]